ncbi:TPA: hypothetical protein DIC20_02365 [Candidatus Dependentiae bacterium]|nr:MAG: hypothetical protein US03_C0003G0030 [candidate division TM6 bacterium GW2011_GWF2_36_131]KKQ03349.1 MAG: hypothetical protein US13_C0003G0030 [candidate division TM6 bacterium GW2011_GWE2_36_25]KKQ19745.1 MAG: hypothetical protein US32_C0005G0029 [candidate division TM6 bacterium GW2011_GWA2_36_9]HBR70873.1 hypothetical protein [Candidatus Dependentiae bacterium]HCU00524.1 hypothetical protein [Candidatus Dependentiae bacterium]
MISKILHVLWGKLTREEYKKFGILGIAIMLILGNYWMLRTTKNPLFDMLVGLKRWQPVAKAFSLIFMIFIVIGYSKLVDIFKKNRLIYVMCSLYSLAFIIISYLLAHSSIIIIPESSTLYPIFAWIPGKLLGWFAYILLESYGTLVVALFYSFVASVMTADLAKKGYGLMTFIIQFGTIGGSLFTATFVKKIGIPVLYLIGGFIIMIVPFVIRYYLHAFPEDIAYKNPPSPAKKSTGFFSGLKLLLTHSYILGIFVVATSYEIMATIVEYQMNYLATDMYTTEEFTVFTSYEALGINILALLFAFFGTSFFLRKLGLRFCLIAFPLAIAAIISFNFTAYIFGFSSYSIMWILLFASIAIKGTNYALNKPTSEILYIPTSKDIKFKAKGWIDMFGNRSTKSLGAGLSKVFSSSFTQLISYSTFISLGFIAFWLFVASFAGNRFNKLQKDKTIIE